MINFIVIVIERTTESKTKGKDEAEEKTPCWVYCTWIAILIIIIIVLAVLFLFSKHQHARNGGVGSGMSLGGGGMGGGGMCFDATMTIWAKNETEHDKDAKLIMAKDVEEGDLVKTVDFASLRISDSDFTWTRATDVDIFWGKWQAYNFVFENGHHIRVTKPHVMIIWRSGQWYFVRADQVQMGDQMKVDQEMVHVIEVFTNIIKAKVAIETEDGTIQVNNVLTSGFCDDTPQASSLTLKAWHLLHKYKQLHFGDITNNACMDNVSWKNMYLKNNGQHFYREMLNRMDTLHSL